MASTINPSNVDGTFPQAGQDNDTQGFRDNFTNIKTNFSAAKTEIEALQGSSVTTSSTNNFNFTGTIQKALLRNNAEVLNQIGTASGTVEIDVSVCNSHSLVTSGSVTFNITNWPVTGLGSIIRVTVTVSNIAHTLTLPSGVTEGLGSVHGIDTATRVITFPSAGVYTYDFMTLDGGNNIRVKDFNHDWGNLILGNNTIAATNTDGGITIAPNGLGRVNIDNIFLNNNTIGTTDTNGDLVLSPDGTGQVQIDGEFGFFSGPVVVNSILDEDTLSSDSNAALATQQSIKAYVDANISAGSLSTIPLSADSGTAETIINGDTLTLSGGANISTVSSASDTITISLDTAVTGLTSLTVDNLTINGNTIISDDTNGHIVLNPDGTGQVQVAAANALLVNSIVTGTGTNDDMSIEPDGTGIVLMGGSKTIGTTGVDTNLVLNPNGTGVVVIQDEVQVTTVSTPATNTDLQLTPNGTGSVLLGGTTAIFGTSTTDQDLTLSPNGTGVINFDIPNQTTVGAAGGASALPATPTGYINVKVGGASYVIPFYDAV
jgi:hypothetical protein